MEIVKQALEQIVQRYGNALEAVILIGSFARGEEIIRKKKDGSQVIVSDLEFLAVVKGGVIPLKIQAPSIEGIDVTIGQATKDQLRKLRPTIFAVDLKKFGKVLWGRLNILDYVPDYTETAIDPVDAFILLNNRIVEQLKLRLKIEAERPFEYYLYDKGYIQIVNSILAFKRKYKCLYPEKYKAFTELNDPQVVYLSKQVKEAFDNCRKGRPEKIMQSGNVDQWSRLRESMKRVWHWEAKELLNNPQLTFKQAVNDFPKIVSKPERLKGWAKLLKQKKLSLLGLGTLKNIMYTSPQFLIYQDAVSLYFVDGFNKEKVERVVSKWEKIVK